MDQNLEVRTQLGWGSDNDYDEMMYEAEHVEVAIDVVDEVDDPRDYEEHNNKDAPIDLEVDGLSEYEEHDDKDAEQDQVCTENARNIVYNGEKPYEGMKFEDAEQAYSFYNKYAKMVGFGVRKGGVRRSKKDGSIIGRRFYCNKEGFREKRYTENAAIKKRRRGETRVGCKARMYVNKSDDGMWVVSLFEGNHEQHKCETPKKTHLFSSHRKIDETQSAIIRKMKDSGIRTNLLMHYFSEEAQGRHNVGFTERDMRNHLRTRRQKIFQKGDAQCLLDYLHERQSENPHFFYAIQLDEQSQMTNFFWVDAKARQDYNHFGDVVCLDATYGTNKYAKPFVPIVGVNNHLQTVMFGCALMLDETEASFTWVLQTWMKAMKGSYPKVIFTDQDAAMAGAISSVLPKTRHRLCLWHIFQNVKKHLGHLFRRGSSFGKDFYYCVRNYETIEEFERGWSIFLTKYNLHSNEWIAKLYSKREKWVPVYSHDFFCADMSTTQRSESINKFFKGFLDNKMLLLDFVKGVDKALVSRREAENDADFKMNNVQPPILLRMPIEESAGKLYTPSMFQKFQDELIGSLRYICEKTGEEGSIFTYRCTTVNSENKYRLVTFNSLNYDAKCSCRKFEFMGILCKHILRVFIVENVHGIPEKYILNRWTVSAKERVVTDERGYQIQVDSHPPLSLRFSILCSEAIDVATVGASTTELYEVAREGFRRTMEEVEDAKKQLYSNSKNSSAMNKENVDDVTLTTKVRDPKVVKTKGRPGRYKAFWEKKTPASKKKKDKPAKNRRGEGSQDMDKGLYTEAQSANLRNLTGVSENTFSTYQGLRSGHYNFQEASIGLSTTHAREFFSQYPVFEHTGAQTSIGLPTDAREDFSQYPVYEYTGAQTINQGPPSQTSSIFYQYQTTRDDAT